MLALSLRARLRILTTRSSPQVSLVSPPTNPLRRPTRLHARPNPATGSPPPPTWGMQTSPSRKRLPVRTSLAALPCRAQVRRPRPRALTAVLLPPLAKTLSLPVRQRAAAVLTPQAHQGTCRCAANFYGDPKDTNGNELLVVTQGCTACPYGGTANAGSAAVTSCTPACGSECAAHQACRCAANFYGDPQRHQGTCRCAANFYGHVPGCAANSTVIQKTRTAMKSW